MAIKKVVPTGFHGKASNMGVMSNFVAKNKRHTANMIHHGMDSIKRSSAPGMMFKLFSKKG